MQGRFQRPTRRCMWKNMNPFAASFQAVREQIARAEARYGRRPGSTELLAVSKTQPPARVRALHALGQRHFGESYLQEALAKMAALEDLPLTWHFIGHVQSNKSAEVAARFSWVHSVDRTKLARRLSEQRPMGLPPLNVCVQVNISAEASKAGVEPAELDTLLAAVAILPRLKLRGLMTLPAPEEDLQRQRLPFRRLAALFAERRDRYGLDTLSMGTTADLEAAIAEGATFVRVGTALFGPRT
ncbi:MAG: Pyridoxal phosphate homeostasis protein [Gammaproteobacteria bacterium]|nr:Pyridoxal phosphate homeostasis protein [Gammaproteobacteria bacterium]